MHSVNPRLCWRVAALGLLAVEVAQRRALATTLSDIFPSVTGSPDPDALRIVTLQTAFFLAMGLLIVIGFVHVALAVPDRRPPEVRADLIAARPGG